MLSRTRVFIGRKTHLIPRRYFYFKSKISKASIRNTKLTVVWRHSKRHECLSINKKMTHQGFRAGIIQSSSRPHHKIRTEYNWIDAWDKINLNWSYQSSEDLCTSFALTALLETLYHTFHRLIYICHAYVLLIACVIVMNKAMNSDQW